MPIGDPGHLILRTDAGSSIGNGHAMRCIALGEAWISAGGTAELLVAELPGWIAADATRRGIVVTTRELERGSAFDAAEVLELGRRRQPQWVVLDGYCFVTEFQRSLAECRLLVIDDHAVLGPHVAEMVLDQNFGADPARYAEISPGVHALIGSEFALVRSEFARLRPPPRHPPDETPRVLISLGGAAPEVARSRVEAAAALLRGSGVEVDLLTGSDEHDVPERMAAADVALTASGTSVWELCCLRVPLVLVTVAENQVPVASRLAAHGAAIYAGWYADVSETALSAHVSSVLRDPGQWRRRSDAAGDIIDGAGARRVVASMRELAGA